MSFQGDHKENVRAHYNRKAGHNISTREVRRGAWTWGACMRVRVCVSEQAQVMCLRAGSEPTCREQGLPAQALPQRDQARIAPQVREASTAGKSGMATIEPPDACCLPLLSCCRFASGKSSLLDLCCGRGGDIHKWHQIGVRLLASSSHFYHCISAFLGLVLMPWKWGKSLVF